MPAPFNPQELQRLEQEAAQAEKVGDHLDALDIYEEVVRNGWAAARHLTAMGFCYMKIRQRQDARSCWLRAFAMDPSHQPVLDALDQYFPGWENQSAAVSTGAGRREEPDAAPPPPPPPPSFQQAPSAGLSIESVPARAEAPTPPPQRSAPAPRPAAPARPAAPPAASDDDDFAPVTPRRTPRAPEPDEQAAFAEQSTPSMSVTTSAASISSPSITISPTAGGSVSHGEAPPARRERVSHFGSKVNWEYVMEDAAAEAAIGASRH